MAKKKVLLADVLGDLVSRGEAKHVELQNGLRVAFTPAAENDGRFRLCLSRRGRKLSSQMEATTVWAHLVKSKALKRPWERVRFEMDGRGCWIIEWVEGEQRPLFDLGEKVGGGNGYDE